MQKIEKFIYWTPRIVSIFFILFLALFSLDVFESASGFWETALALFMHNIPSLVLLAIVIISWKHEIVGGIAFIAAAVLYVLFMYLSGRFMGYESLYSLIIVVPAFFIGILFLIGWKKRKIGKKH